jgi:hypothetical protein
LWPVYSKRAINTGAIGEGAVYNFTPKQLLAACVKFAANFFQTRGNLPCRFVYNEGAG